MSIRIFIDQGHNPCCFNTGAEGGGMTEQDINYNVGLYLKALLRYDGRFDVRLSRNFPSELLGYDNSSSLRARVDMANSWPADYFLSIHCNANTNSAINGTEMYIYSTQSESYPLARQLLDAVVSAAGTRDNQVRVNSSLYVLRNTRMPAVLAELAYMSNASDVEKLRYNQYEFAYGLYNGFLRYFGF